eukprot:CAMPEP_0195524256 /NCGR_PEP_ID=MMETSP0794_2-20130614/23968_1 /TAXON_ID=515487 /ORGANISM="Stephanopyxis turris, Strain CCMP 815" /LENGTH=689 /DNA_ID=CAMNT_0040654433 /DNA_START=70 /DNA_END=2139 /DNA_ORIENTATION=+
MRSSKKLSEHGRRKFSRQRFGTFCMKVLLAISLVYVILFFVVVIIFHSNEGLRNNVFAAPYSPIRKSTLIERLRQQHDVTAGRVEEEEVVIISPLKKKAMTHYNAELSLNRNILKLEQRVDASACRKFHESDDGDKQQIVAVMDDKCRELVSTEASSSGELIAFNPLDEERLLCGVVIPHKRPIHLPLNESCLEPTRLFPVEPTLNGKGLPPIRIGDKGPFENWQCDVPCQIGTTSRTRTIFGTSWSFQFSMEGEHYYGNLKIFPRDYLNDHYFATTSFKSEVPLPYFSWAEYSIQEPAVDFDKVIKGASFIARNCNSKNNREGVVQGLIDAGFRVDSLSGCLNNARPPNGLNMNDKKKVQQQYLFHLAFENGCVDDYITEKMWGTLQSGTLPVYFGAPNVRDHVPENSIIIVQDFPTHEDLADYLHEVANNRTLYESYHAWRKKLPQSFIKKYNFTHTHSNCRMCRWAYAKNYGLGWNHEDQRVEETFIPRTLMLDGNTGEIRKPFQEQWMDTSGKFAVTTAAGTNFAAICEDFSCSKKYQTMDLPKYGLTRTVWAHDGVIDVYIDGTNYQGNTNDLIFRLNTDVKSQRPIRSQSSKRDNKFTFVFQDSHTRFTLLTSWDAQVSISRLGVVDISLDKGSFSWFPNLVVRIIVENIDTFHQGGEKKGPYYFASRMTNDFFNSVEILRVA